MAGNRVRQSVLRALAEPKHVKLQVVVLPRGRFYHPKDTKMQGPLYTATQLDKGFQHVPLVNGG